MNTRGTLRRVLAVQAATSAAAEGSNWLVRHQLTFLQQYWAIHPFLLARYIEHVQYQFLGVEGVPGRELLAALVALWCVTGFWYSTRVASELRTVTGWLMGLLLGGLLVNGAEIAAFGQATDFLGIQIPGLGMCTLNLADIAIGLGLSGLITLWLRPGWRQARPKFALAMTIGAALVVANPISAVVNPTTPPSPVSATAVGVAAQARAQRLWGPGIAVRNVHPVPRCLVTQGDCRRDSGWLWEIDMFRPRDFYGRGQPAVPFRRYADYRTGRIL